MKICIGRKRIASELCTLCGAYVAVVIFSSSNKVYSCEHPSAELNVDKFLGENQPGFDAPNSTSLSHQNVNVDEIKNELNMLEISLIELLEAADEDVERVASQVMEYDMEFPKKVYSCGHPSAKLIVDKFLQEKRQPDIEAPNPTILANQNVNVDDINNELNMLENSLKQQKKQGKDLKILKKELPYEQLSFSDLKKLIELLEAADEEVERVESHL
uniref:MADS-box domain-containing protein n=1 Tax=Solanum lycopersicum TaxID=4081 RepID=A0A3Q7I396_SOLLC